MQIHYYQTADEVAVQAARWLAAEARAAVALRGRFTLAVSGGSTPWQMLRSLATEALPWQAVEVFQVDERVAPAGDQDRNLTHLQESLLRHAPLRREQIHAMPVEATDLHQAAADYAGLLESIAGSPPVLDVVHLGLGSDGHTASLIPEDSVLQVQDRDVAITGVYQGRQRMTLTYPVLNRARKVLWLIAGASKREMLGRLQAADPGIPAGRVNPEHAVIMADEAARQNQKP